ncbi:MAG: phosphatase PAP2 family protein [bacterium]|nr:phosphatase PAP2 family protein [bacterium]
MKNLIKKLFEYFPTFVIIPLIFVFSSQSLIYFGTKLINSNMQHHTLITFVDKIAPIIPSFSIIYLGCYIFWVLNYALAGRVNKDYFYDFVSNIFLGYIISGIIFCVFPTYINRPDLNEIHGLGKMFVTYVYNTDTPVNLFPSMHCQISWYCYLAVKGRNQISKWYQYFSLIIAVLVCISTVVIRQHYFLDIVAGVAIAEFTYRLAMKKHFGKPISVFFERINTRLHLN